MLYSYSILNLAVEYPIKKVHQILTYDDDDDVNPLGDNIDTIKKTEIVINLG
jgi:hypothetical protein